MMKITALTSTILLGTALLLLNSPAHAQSRVAQLTTVSGKVEIQRADSNKIDVARQLGPRVRNGSVFANDIVSTGPDANAKIVFSDGSEVKLVENTSLSIRESKVPDAGPAGKQAVGRTIKVMAGKVLADVIPGGTIITRFETPSGVAAVKGTSLTIEVGEPQSG
jgi:hypothetical protein